MDEEKTTKKEEPEKAVVNTDERSKPEIYKPIDDANLAAKRLEEANKKKEELLNREEEIAAKRALGGQSEAGQEPAKKKELTDEEYAEQVSKEKADPFKEDGVDF